MSGGGAAPREPIASAADERLQFRLLGGAADGPLSSIPGTVPNLSRPPSGCRFHPRCVLAQPVCRVDPPPLAVVEPLGAAETPAAKRSASYIQKEGPGLS